MIRIRDISLPPDHTEHQLPYEAARVLKLSPSQIRSLRIVRRSIDARKKPDIRVIYTVDVAVSGSESKILRQCGKKNAAPAPTSYYKPPKGTYSSEFRPVVIGFGPAGIFAALILAERGLRPLVLERGRDGDTRQAQVEAFWSGGPLDPESNVQFGEGGAGAFSDGKLNTGVNDPRIHWILQQFVEAGAQEEILYDAKPHVGTDVLHTVVKNLRRRIERAGGEIRFGAKLRSLSWDETGLTGLTYTEAGAVHTLPCRQVILATGHSARDTVQALYEAGVPMAQKPFSMGVRIEHPQAAVNRAQYGDSAKLSALPPADYHLSCHLPEGDSAYTFCMCPGGYVVAAASEPEGVVTNGMSYAARAGENANAALLVTLRPEDFPERDPLSGMRWQREIEHRAFLAGGANYHAPAQTVGDFLAHKKSESFGHVSPTYRPGVTPCDFHDILPERITGTLERAISALDRKLSGFADPQALLTGPETRSSSPVRILRDDSLQSEIRGLYPCGEGAGYAGGITSAAVDGIRCAEALLEALSK